MGGYRKIDAKDVHEEASGKILNLTESI